MLISFPEAHLTCPIIVSSIAMISRANYTCLLALFVASTCSYAEVFFFRNETSCSTDGRSGICTVVFDCDYAINIIKRSGISSAESQNFLTSNKCGFEGNTPKICCPEEESVVDNRNAFKQESRIESSDEEENFNTEESDGKNPSLLLPELCGVQLFTRIFGGEDAKLSDFPWLVALEYNEAGTEEPIIGCGGTLITKRYVLTAAHCVRTTSNVRLTNVRLGEYNLVTKRDCVEETGGKKVCADPALSVAIESKIVHEDFMSPKLYRNDVALLRLAYDVPVTPYIQPICLPLTNETGEIYWSAGWGQTETKRNSDVKLKIRLPYFDFDQCAAKYKIKKVILGKGQMCAGGEAAKDTCRGDSGGPLMRQVKQGDGTELWVIEGVLSLGTYDCGLAKWPAVYTKVHEYLPWILSKIRS